MEEMGMTNEQYKGMLVDEREDWKRVKEIAEKNDDQEAADFAQKKIDIINEKLNF